MKRLTTVWLSAAALWALAAGTAAASAIANGTPIYTLKDENSEVSFDLDTGLGMINWWVNDEVQLERQWFWYRVGDSGPEIPLFNGADPYVETVATLDTDGDTDFDTLFARYVGSVATVELRFSLMGGVPGTGWSDLVEQIRFENTGEEPLDMHLFQYCDFDLGGDPTDEEVWIFGPPDDEERNVVYHDDLFEGFWTDTVVTPAAHHWQADDSQVLLGLLTDAAPTTLNDTDYFLGGPDVDPAWAFQWDGILEPGLAVVISKDKLIVPEPATVALLGVGLIAGVVARRRRR